MNWQAISPCSKQRRGGVGRSSLTPVLWWSRWLLAGSSSAVRRYDALLLERPFPSIGTRSTRWRRTRADCNHDDLSEGRTVHVKCKAAKTIGTQPPEPCPPKGRRSLSRARGQSSSPTRRLLRQLPGRKHFEVDGAVVLTVGVPRQPKCPAACRRQVHLARTARDRHDGLGLAQRTTFDREAFTWVVLGYPVDLVVGAVHARTLC